MDFQSHRDAFDDAIRFYRSLIKLGGRDASKIIGIAGELWVKSELLRNGIGFEARGGQSKFDIKLRKTGERIEIRTSTLKRFSKSVDHYGWTVLKRKEVEPEYDYLVCVAFHRDLFSPESTEPSFYVFTARQALEFSDEVKMPRIGSVKKRILIFENLQDLATARRERSEDVRDWNQVRELNRRKEEFGKRGWESLRK